MNKYLRMSRDDEDDLMVESGQIISRDVMATNGVVHIVDGVIIPAGVEDIMDVAEKAGATLFVKLAKVSGFDGELHNMTNFTVFLPSNDALEMKMKNEQSALRAMLSNHVVPRRLNSHDLDHGQMLPTLNGKQEIRVSVYHQLTYTPKAHAAVQCSSVVTADLEACGSIAHVVDKMILPPSGDVLDVLKKSKDYSELLSLVQLAGLTDLLKGNKLLTMFAPTNKAFAALPKSTLDQLKTDAVKAKKVILGHMVGNVLCCSGVFNPQLFTPHELNLDGWMIVVERSKSGEVLYGGVAVQSCDQTATNGVVHSLDIFSPPVVKRHDGSLSRKPSRPPSNDGLISLADLLAEMWANW
jgi:transforming growth factor-beta-induced protein